MNVKTLNEIKMLKEKLDEANKNVQSMERILGKRQDERYPGLIQRFFMNRSIADPKAVEIVGEFSTRWTTALVLDRQAMEHLQGYLIKRKEELQEQFDRA